MQRVGLLAKKVGMTQFFNEDGSATPVTVLMAKDCTVVGHRIKDKDGYNALILGLDAILKEKNVNKAQKGYAQKHSVKPMKFLKEFRISDDNYIDIGNELSVDHFYKGQFIDVSSVSIGKGFAGAMKRHNFGGLRASHGVSVSHRAHGSTGQCQDPGRVFKGKKMAGHLGAKRVTMQNLEVYGIDIERSLIFVKGGIPGHEGTYVELKDSVKKINKDLVFPGKIKGIVTEESSVLEKEAIAE